MIARRTAGGRSRLVSFEAWHITNEDSLSGGEEEGGAGGRTTKHGGTQVRTHWLEGRKREERDGELPTGGDRKEGLTGWRGGRGRRRLVSLEAWHGTNEGSSGGGEEEGGAGW